MTTRLWREPPRRAAAAVTSLRRDASVSAVVAGFIAVAVSFAGPMLVVLSAASAGALDPAHTASWIWAVSLGSGLVGLVASLLTRTPVVAAWSTPGAALLTTGIAEYGYAACVGAYLVVAVATIALGVTGWFGRMMEHVPGGVLSAVLAGILVSFGLDIFRAMQVSPLVPAVALVTYLLAKRYTARYAVVVALLCASLVAVVAGEVHLGPLGFVLARPVWTTPHFGFAALIGLAVPLFIVTMASQNAPGLAVLRACGYRVDDRKLLGATGTASLVLAPFGSHAINLAAITAAICAGPQAHPDPRRRYVAGVSCGVWYLVFGALGAGVLTVFTGLPKSLVLSVAGIALLGALLSGLVGALAEEGGREAALLAFLVTASGVTAFGIGSAFWGLVLGVCADRLLRPRTSG